ncbi:hypothetical protein JVT61DRAFT_8883 [Boletus reticuloceps]|uniref:non-specific serine/threonine protein kinase n=1 Tax=Boletus reticuloceps TaxID=495285 RepID=A0A8I3A5J4_9AGAM|nr:hypothetical protein JVT61DRAFT_8883 [Boletus reticuloceps]
MSCRRSYLNGTYRGNWLNWRFRSIFVPSTATRLVSEFWYVKSQVEFWICLNGKVITGPPSDKCSPLAVLFNKLQHQPATRVISSDVDVEDCKFYKLTPPLLSPGTLEGLRDECLNNSHNWKPVDAASLVQDLASDDCLSFKYMCLVIETPQVPHANAIKDLGDHHKALFWSLQIRVIDIKSWSMSDVEHNMNGGVFWYHGEQPGDMAIRDFDAALSRHRHIQPICNIVRELMPEAFNQYFQRGSPMVKDTAEFWAVHNLYGSYCGFKQISECPSSHLKGSVLGSFFFQPPFHYCKTESSRIAVEMEFPWGFPIFIATLAKPADWYRFTPSSDYSVIVEDFLCPFLLCEVISESRETDRYRMLLQGIAAVRAVNTLKKFGSEKDLFVVAVYLKANLTAERYIIMQASTEQVHIAQRDYNLLDIAEALEFLKAMFNLQDQTAAFIEELDNSRAQKGSLSKIADIAHPIITLPRQRKTGTGGTKETKSLRSILEAAEQSVPSRGNDLFQVCPLERGILKFTKRQSEVDVLQYLSKFTCEENYTIPGVQVWTLPAKGFVIYSRFGGRHFTDLSKPDVHMWSAAKQLVEGVAFMHSQGVAHLDIKPENVLIHPDSGRLSIIDCSVSQFVKSDTKLHAVRGTEDYIAPEVNVKHPEYDPIRADLWSCGKTLQELIARSRQHTKEKAFLVGIIGQLMADDPLTRPMMSEVLKQMIAFESPIVMRPRSARSTPT